MSGAQRRRAFTLMELLIAFAVLVVVTFMLYQMLVKGTSGAVRGIWRTTTQRGLQNTSERVRKALEGASYPSVLTPEFNQVDEKEPHFVVVGKGKGPVDRDLEITTEQDQSSGGGGGAYFALGPGRQDGSDAQTGDRLLILAATNCSPAQHRIAGLEDKAGVAKHHWFWLQDEKPVLRGGKFAGAMSLMYAESESQAYGADDAASIADVSVPGHPLGDPPDRGKVLVSDVNSVRIRVSFVKDDGTVEEVADSVSLTDASGRPVKPTIEIGIRCVDRDSGLAVMGKTITVQPNVGVKWLAQ